MRLSNATWLTRATETSALQSKTWKSSLHDSRTLKQMRMDKDWHDVVNFLDLWSIRFRTPKRRNHSIDHSCLLSTSLHHRPFHNHRLKSENHSSSPFTHGCMPWPLQTQLLRPSHSLRQQLRFMKMSFPREGKAFLDRQEKLRKSDKVPEGAELIFLLPSDRFVS